MTELSRYDVGSGVSGLDGKILKNKLGIKDQKTLSDTETILLNDAYFYFLEKLSIGKLIFNTRLILEINKYFLGTLYNWAGKLREVNISKGNSMFAPVQYLPITFSGLDEILTQVLSDKKTLAAGQLSKIVCEFNFVHPFREGNGRTIRLFIDLLLVKNGYKMFDYTGVSEKRYIAACIAGMKKDYKKMTNIFKFGLEKK
ncbi:MAG: hypothetical protein ACD_72C00152G0004 [uncultured bacterium]|nr:MAG: hypothetical protein ACD_72C00152G0004 [uncultured bacterium]